jgi:chromosome segregation ATPase
MDKETLRKQIYDEVRAEFDGKLKDARRQKQLADEELENSTERWRTERRRLNGQIDRLEGALADAKEGPRRRGRAEKPAGVDPVEVAKIQAAADERLKKAAKEWEGERNRLNAEISRLHNDIAEAIERRNNPLRAELPRQEKFEARIRELEREKAEIAGALSRATAEWDQEKVRLAGEILKLRRGGGTAPASRGKAAESDEARVKELEKQLQTLQTASREWDKERKQTSDHAAQLQNAFFETRKKLDSLTASIQPVDHEACTQELARVRASLDQSLQRAQIEWDAERQRLSSEIEQLRKTIRELTDTRESASNEIAGQLRKEYDEKIQEIIQQKTQLAEQHQTTSALLDTERARFTAEISELKSAAVQSSDGGNDGEAETITAEVERVEGQIREIGALIDDLSTDLATVIRKNVEKAELDAYLKGIRFSLQSRQGRD